MERALRVAFALAFSAYFWAAAASPAEWHFIDGANIVFHEAGHAIFSFLGELVQVASGSAFQVALPLFIAAYFFIHAQRLSCAVCLMWAGQSLANVSVYASDAADMALPLLGGDSVIHDWNYLLGRFGLLDSADAVGAAFRVAAYAVVAAGSLLALYYALYEKNRPRGRS